MRIIQAGLLLLLALCCGGCAFYSDSDISPPSPTAPRIIAVERPSTTVVPKEQLGEIRNRVAVVVGISNYLHEGEGRPKLRNLNYASADADALAAHLIQSGFNTVEVLTDQKATLPEIRKAIVERVARAGKDDFVLVFWAGHGMADPADRQKLYLMTYDSSPDDLGDTAYAMADFRGDVAKTASQRLMIVIDTCHSGGVTDPTISYRSASSGDVQESLRGVYVGDESAQVATASAKSSAMRLVFTACEAGEFSAESSDKGHGVFTYYLLEAMQGKADRNGDGVVTLNEVLEYTREQVKTFSEDRQHPATAGRFDREVPLGVLKK